MDNAHTVATACANSDRYLSGDYLVRYHQNPQRLRVE
ncbi:Hypothetical protein CpCP13_0960 [Corynebacterium pseudotuberculosis]|nr:Hypothetical protein CpPAT10_0937a [Corynebacterium pseudotuberculosis PAT10]AFF22092.1 Hypothetical protein CpP54B96_0953 [Corynebacterium pseudotuberculosis P54B96]AFH51880.1 Hypothetical protein Cp267_0980 [Corynebacterium pseudotuberculosis 267]AJC13678.1 hypothetical protein CpVD57_0961 [Corynebacterium pseudotuberculosis]ANQ77131.1 Hypothetical protein CpCP13_0960 [Corynebacterium pseudotuberculosis]